MPSTTSASRGVRNTGAVPVFGLARANCSGVMAKASRSAASVSCWKNAQSACA
jgi:hypothetical protein